MVLGHLDQPTAGNNCDQATYLIRMTAIKARLFPKKGEFLGRVFLVTNSLISIGRVQVEPSDLISFLTIVYYVTHRKIENKNLKPRYSMNVHFRLE